MIEKHLGDLGDRVFAKTQGIESMTINKKLCLKSEKRAQQWQTIIF